MKRKRVDSNPDVDTVTKDGEESSCIIVHNTSNSTVTSIASALRDICHHTVLQADQCAFLVKNKGECVVKEGEYGRMIVLCNMLVERDLHAEVK